MDLFERWPATAENPNGFSREPVPEIKDYKSYSRVKVFRRSPRHYWWQYVLGKKDKDTPDKDEGRLIHKCILETDSFMEHLKVRPSKDDHVVATKDELYEMAVNAGADDVKRSWSKPRIVSSLLSKDPSFGERLYDCALADFESGLSEDDLVVTPDQGERFIEIMRSVNSHPVAKQLVSGGDSEVCAYWFDKEFGCVWRSAIDHIRIGKSTVWITDVKSSRDASPWRFPADIDQHGYHLQNWIYRRVVGGITGMPVEILQLVVEKSPPYICEVYRPDTRSEETAYWEILRMMERWRACESSGHWPGYNEDKIAPIGLPNYAYWRIEESADREIS